MLCLKTTDNNCGKVISECFAETNGVKPNFEKRHYSDLTFFANAPLKELVQKNRELLVFPHCLEQEKTDKTFGKILGSKILEMYGGENDLDNVKIKTGNLMGFVGKGKVLVEIASRFASGEKDMFLHYMLSKVFGSNLLELDFTASNIGIFDILPLMFPNFLKKALSQGVYKTYRTFERNDANVKGPIDVSRHIRQNVPFCGRIAYRERTRTADNPLTELVRHTIEFIKAKPFGNAILSRDKDIRDAAIQIMESTPSYNRLERQKVIAKNAQPTWHPYFTEWLPLQRLCLAILNVEKIKYHREQKTVYGILFDGAWLWEEYLNTILKEEGFTHPDNKKGTGGIRMFKKPEVEGKIDTNYRRIYPDFYRKTGENPDWILDAKYQHLEKDPKRENLYQIVSYMHTMKCARGGFVFPYKESDSETANSGQENFSKEFELDGCGGSVFVFGMRIPQNSEDFEKFGKEMEASEKRLVKNVFAPSNSIPPRVRSSHRYLFGYNKRPARNRSFIVWS